MSFPAASNDGRSWVYFATARALGIVKIGYSSMLAERLQAVGREMGCRVTVEAAIPGGFKTEHKVHRQFDAHRLHGEWFRLAPEIEAAMLRARSLGRLESAA